MPDPTQKDIRQAIMRMLARREFSEHELRQRLRQLTFTESDIDVAIADAVAFGWLSDERFTASRIRHGADKGWGPLRIWNSLQQHHIDRSDFDAALEALEIEWLELARRVKVKKFGEQGTADRKLLMKQQQFLRYRGFNHEQIEYALANG
jgi:regulatory protein